MLTLKLINEETNRVIRGLEKKHFPNAKEAIGEVLAVDKKRREAQQELDKCLNEQKQLSGQIGRLMKEGKKNEAEQVRPFLPHPAGILARITPFWPYPVLFICASGLRGRLRRWPQR